MRRAATLSIAVAAGLLWLVPLRAAAEGWGTVKGQVVWAGGAVPERPPLKVTQNQQQCLKNGPLLSEKLVVSPKSKGVRWVVVWLVDPASPTKAMPINPALKKPKTDTVTIDQPCCMFEPHVVALREGQTLVVKNSADIAHNVKLDGGSKGPNLNRLIPAGGEVKVTDIKARTTPIPVACNIHPWMNGWVRVFKNPYYAVTDADGNFEIKGAPAGDWRLVVWQEDAGWVGGRSPKAGATITVKPGEVTNVGEVGLK